MQKKKMMIMTCHKGSLWAIFHSCITLFCNIFAVVIKLLFIKLL